jgi:hypothetical protein
MRRVWGLVVRPAVLTLAVCIPVAGCSTACPAIGWANAITVELTGDLSRVETVQLCADGACSELGPRAAPSAPRSIAPTLVNPSAPVTPAAQPTTAPFYAERIDADTWRFTVSMSSPDHVTAKALSAIGEVLAEKEAALDWKRVGGSAQCGGPAEASPVLLTVPSG